METPDVALVQLPTYAQAKEYMGRIVMQGLMRAKGRLAEILPPNVLPFWELGEVVEMSAQEWRVVFPKKAAVAKEMVRRNKSTIEQCIASQCASSPKLVLT